MQRISWQSIGARLSDTLKSGQEHPVPLPQAGLYHYVVENPPEKSRVHLRIHPDGSGILIVNANRVLHLNATAAYMAYLSLRNTTQHLARHSLNHYYRASGRALFDDYNVFAQQLDELIRPDGACPIHELDLPTIAPFSERPFAPYRMDLALTYRCNDNCAHCYNARPRNFAEISTSQWLQIIDYLWDLGIPHIVFTGGEPTLRPDLPELIAYAESKGQITGLNTNGRNISNPDYLQTLVDAGLDHVQVTVESHDPQIHDRMVGAKGAWQETIHGVQNALQTRLYVMTNTTMLQDNAPSLAQTLDFLGELGVPTVGLNALIHSGRGLNVVDRGLPERDLAELLILARQRTDTYGQRLIWYTPTQYCNFDPVEFELGVKGCTAALYNMCIEPNGDVLPCQSFYQPVGNLLQHSWDQIWHHKLAEDLRERKIHPTKCNACALLQECGGGCPLMMHMEKN